MATKTIKTGIGQSLINIALQEYGCYEGFALVIEDNPALVSGIDHVFAPNTELIIQTPVPELTSNNVQIAAELARRSVKISGNYTPTDVSINTSVFESGVFENDVFI